MPDEPATPRIAPTLVAPDTFLVHDHVGGGRGPDGQAAVLLAVNSLVIRGREPVVVDTGAASNGAAYLADVFALVEPEDVRWVFLSHEDGDHSGNAGALMARCPNATLVVSRLMGRWSEALPGPPSRRRSVDDREAFDAGDRRLVAIRPPVFDAPTTRGLFDPSTGLYWAVDAFATPMAAPAATVAELGDAWWGRGAAALHHLLAPWLAVVDDRRYQRGIDRIEALGVTAIAAAHTPFIDGAHVDTAFGLLRSLPSADVGTTPDQRELCDLVERLAT